MLTPGQEKWIASLSDTSIIKIIPFDPTIEAKYQIVKRRIPAELGD